VIITGGAGGIGTHISRALVDDGFKVLVIGRNQTKFDKLYESINNKDSIEFFQLNVALVKDVSVFFRSINNSHHRLFALINCFGTQIPIGNFSKIDTEEWVNNISVNLLGTSNMIRGSIPFLVGENNPGKIINFSGGGGTSSRPNFSAYAVSKTAIVRLTEILAEESKDSQIDINVVAPGPINTGMLEDILEAGMKSGKEFEEALERKKRGGESPKKIVDLCRFLLSKESDGISGKLISAVWDDYRDPSFLERLKFDPDFCCLRRVDGTNFDRQQ
jgi:NAD(P)-dependent dehydrogenase (short-subunit alcohol dehydrogenase family)|tara:strand:+ start:82 stop:906 length:825 start_codon:yes stop_codon:yes gene_type:complete